MKETGKDPMPGDLNAREETNPGVSRNGGRAAFHIIAIAAALIIILVIAGGVIVNDAMKPQHQGFSNATGMETDGVFQVSTIDALSSGLYDGVATVGEIQQHGDFGSGTFEGMDGELIALDGSVYQATSDGSVRLADPSKRVPFAEVKFFRQDLVFDIPGGKTMSDTENDMAMQFPSKNLVYAIKARATFPDITVRAIPKQEKPYPLLVTAAAQESIFHLKNSTGTIVGFYFPDSFNGVNIPGYHLHFISDDRSKGGHVLDFRGPDTNLTIVADKVSTIIVTLPTTGDYLSADLSKGSSSGNIASIETKSS
jgi:acetolactate decarboxylase